jgi:N-acyl-D-aspartate/D-glutamate deacylase
MPTDCMPDETALELARVLAQRNEGFIQMTYVSGDPEHDLVHFEELAEVSGRPILYNAVVGHASYPNRHKKQLEWLRSCRERGLSVYGQGMTTATPYFFDLEGWNLFDDSDAWMEATTGTHEEKMHKLADPARREGLREGAKQISRGAVIKGFEYITPVKFTDALLAAKYTEISLVDIAAIEGKHIVDVMLDLAVADNLQTVFFAENATNSFDMLRDLLTDPYIIPGVSDGGAHTKYLTAGRYPTETITRFVRDNEVLSLEEAHWRLSALPAHCAGFKDRGTLQEGAPADIVVYNLEELGMTDSEVAHDFPGGEWRRVQRAIGYHAILVNGEQTFSHGKETGALPGSLLRHGGTA